MSKKTKAKKAKSVFGVIFVILLLLMIAVTVTSNVIFSSDADSVPLVGGYYLYLNDSAEMEPDIPQNALVFAKEASVVDDRIVIGQGSKVLCYLPDGNLAPRTIMDVSDDGTGEMAYYPGVSADESHSLSIPRSSIIAVCTWASKDLYSFVKFSTSVPGLMAFLVVPCIILIVLLLVKIAKSSKEEIDEDDFFFDEEEIEAVTRKPAKSKKAPLFDPENTPAADESLEKKKNSISENFSTKPVNENSPYQKAVQERTMKFKRIQQEDLERAQREEAEKAKARKKPEGTQVFSPSEVEESAKTAAQNPAERPASKRRVEEEEAPVPKTYYEDKLKAVKEARKHAAEKPAAEKPAEPAPKPAEPASRPAEKKYSTPNLDDILGSDFHTTSKSTPRSNSDIASTGSIDDLIAVLEKEKKKL